MADAVAKQRRKLLQIKSDHVLVNQVLLRLIGKRYPCETSGLNIQGHRAAIMYEFLAVCSLYGQCFRVDPRIYFGQGKCDLFVFRAIVLQDQLSEDFVRLRVRVHDNGQHKDVVSVSGYPGSFRRRLRRNYRQAEHHQQQCQKRRE